MPLGTIDRTPPPFFRQGPSALTKLVFFSALAFFLMVADTRFKLTEPVRAALATVLQPLQRALLMPVQLVAGGFEYLHGLNDALAGEQRAQQQLARQSERAQRVEQLQAENNRLRALLELRPSLPVRTLAAEILYDAPDPYSRKVVVDRGATQGVKLGSPVIDEAGVLGQVTRVYPLTSEVTLLVDKDSAIPLLNPRTQQRNAAYGTGGGLELRFVAANADVQAGDSLTTSGVDGVYPPGLQVAKVTGVERRAEAGFARITLAPTALPDGVRHVLLLEPLSLQMPERPKPVEEPAAPTKGKAGKTPPRKGPAP
jgi:rod shape-determining protein MreC